MFEQHLRSLHITVSELVGNVATLTEQTTKGFGQMATKVQLDNLMSHVATLIDAGVDEIKAALAAKQFQTPQPETPDLAVDALDARVVNAIASLQSAAAALRSPDTQTLSTLGQPAPQGQTTADPQLQAFPQNAPQPDVPQTDKPVDPPKLG